MLKQFGILAFVMGFQVAHAATCLDAGTVSEVASRIQLPPFTSGANLCEDSKAYELLQALTLIRSLSYSSRTLPAPFNQEFLPTGFWSYFIEGIGAGGVRAIVDQTSEIACPPGVLAYSASNLTHDNTINVCPDFYDHRRSLPERAAALLHEVRHFEGFNHVECAQGLAKGRVTCDDSLDGRGAYSVSVEVLGTLALVATPLISNVDQGLAKIAALQYAEEAFNQVAEPPEDRFAIFVQSVDGQKAQLIQSSRSYPVAPLPVQSIVASRYYSVEVFPERHGDAFTAELFSQTPQRLPALGLFATDYNFTSQEQRESLVDILNLPYFTGAVFERRLQFADGSSIPLPKRVVGAFASAEVGDMATESIYILNEDRTMFRLQPGNGAEAELESVANPIPGIRKIVLLNGLRLGLTFANELLQSSVVGAPVWFPHPRFQGMKIGQITRPFLWNAAFWVPPYMLEAQAYLQAD